MNINSGMSRHAALFVLLLASALVTPLGAAQPGEPRQSDPGYEGTSYLQRHHEMGEVMEQMQQQMKSMSERLLQKDLSSRDRSQIASEMKRMSASMRRMSGLVDRPTMRDAEFKKQMAAMRNEMAATQMPRGEGGGKK